MFPCTKPSFPSLVTSHFSWPCLAASTFYFLRAAINLRQPFVIFSLHTFDFNDVAFRLPTTRYAEHLDVAPYAIDPLFFLLPNSSSLHCTLTGFGYDSLSQLPAVHSDNRPRRQRSFRARRRLNVLSLGTLKGKVEGFHPVFCCFALCLDDAHCLLMQVVLVQDGRINWYIIPYNIMRVWFEISRYNPGVNFPELG